MQEIFLVHDSQESPATRKSFLEMAGYRVTLLKSGAECLELMSKRRPELVVIDVLIEGANGFDLCRAVRERAGAAELPIILGSTIYRSRIYRDEAMAAGAQRYVLRPIKPDELLNVIQEVLEEQRAATEAA